MAAYGKWVKFCDIGRVDKFGCLGHFFHSFLSFPAGVPFASPELVQLPRDTHDVAAFLKSFKSAVSSDTFVLSFVQVILYYYTR